jgi:hypothetical protein
VRLPDFLDRASSDLPLSSPLTQNICPSHLTQISEVVALSRPTEGRFAIVTNAGRDAMDAAASVRDRDRRAGSNP